MAAFHYNVRNARATSAHSIVPPEGTASSFAGSGLAAAAARRRPGEARSYAYN